MTPNHLGDNPTNNAMFGKDYITTTGRLLPSNPFMEDSCIKVGTDIAYNSEEVCVFVDSVPEVGQNSIRNLLIHGLSDTKYLIVSDTITKKNFVNLCQVNSKSRPKENTYP